MAQERVPQSPKVGSKQGYTWGDEPARLEDRLSYTAVASTDSKLYIVGGRSVARNDPTPLVQRYDPADNTVETLQQMSTDRERAAVGVIDGKIYAVGGFSGGFPRWKDVLERYDPDSDSWTTLEPMPTPRDGLSAEVIDGKLYAIGGRDSDNNDLDVVRVYDPDSDSWTTRTPMSNARKKFATGVIDGEIYVAGGDQTVYSDPIQSVERYDPKSDSWTALEPIPDHSDASNGPYYPFVHGGAVLNGELHTVGGYNASESDEADTNVSSVQSYDPTTDRWTERQAYSTRRAGVGVTTVEQTLYVVGGYPFYEVDTEQDDIISYFQPIA